MKHGIHGILLSIAVLVGACGGSEEMAVNSTDSACGTTMPDNPPLTDGYRQFELCGWAVFMNEDLFNSSLASEVYAALADDMNTVLQALPAPAIEYLKDTNIWLELDHAAFPGGVYHPSADWLADNNYPIKWAKGIQFGNAQNYLTWVAQQPAMFLHELSHALDHQYYNYTQPDMIAAYNSAMQAGIYDSVLYVDGGYQAAYATNNSIEYFAELTEAYYWTNDFYPFDRDDLSSHDPTGMAATALLWELR